jgi:hypothetical protein
MSRNVDTFGYGAKKLGHGFVLMGGEGDDSEVNVGEIQRLSMLLNSSGVKDGMPVRY